MSAHYELRCAGCGARGAAEWWATSGAIYPYCPAWGLNLSNNFNCAAPPAPGGATFHGRLVCRGCGTDAEIREIDYAAFHTAARPALCQVAGSRCNNSNSNR